MITPDDVAGLIGAVRARFPRHLFTPENAADLLGGKLRNPAGVDLSALTDGIARFCGDNPDATKPDWERIAAWLRATGKLPTDAGMARQRLRDDTERADTESRVYMAKIDAFAQNHWPELCERAQAKAFVPRPVPEAWPNRRSWVIWLYMAACEMEREQIAHAKIAHTGHESKGLF